MSRLHLPAAGVPASAEGPSSHAVACACSYWPLLSRISCQQLCPSRSRSKTLINARQSRTCDDGRRALHALLHQGPHQAPPSHQSGAAHHLHAPPELAQLRERHGEAAQGVADGWVRLGVGVGGWVYTWQMGILTAGYVGGCSSQAPAAVPAAIRAPLRPSPQPYHAAPAGPRAPAAPPGPAIGRPG